MHPIIRSRSNRIVTCPISIFKVISSIHFDWAMISFTRSNTFYLTFYSIQCRDFTLCYIIPSSLLHRHETNFKSIISIIKPTYCQCGIRPVERRCKFNIKRITLHFGRNGDFITSPTFHLILSKSTGNSQKPYY